MGQGDGNACIIPQLGRAKPRFPPLGPPLLAAGHSVSNRSRPGGDHCERYDGAVFRRRVIDRAAIRRWPVLAWVRLRIPPREAPVLLTPGPPPPPAPPVDFLEPEAVATDPTARLFTFHEPFEQGILRYVWSGGDPSALTVEYRGPAYAPRVPTETVRRFWATVKSRLAEIGPLPVEAADPRS
jgi:hypothetical protein